MLIHSKWVPFNICSAIGTNVLASLAAYAEYEYGNESVVSKGAFGCAAAFGYISSVLNIVSS